MKSISSKVLGLSVLLVLVLAVASQAAVMGPNGHYYGFVSNPGVDWQTANATANGMTYEGLSGHLVTVTSAGEDSWLYNNVYRGLGEVWAGGYQRPATEADETAGWKWVNGEGAFPGVNGQSSYANWLGGEPNDNYDTPSEQASEQYLGLGLRGEFGWNDEGALGNITGFVVEYERSGVPEGTAGLAGILAIVGLFAAHRKMKKA